MGHVSSNFMVAAVAAAMFCCAGGCSVQQKGDVNAWRRFAGVKDGDFELLGINRCVVRR